MEAKKTKSNDEIYCNSCGKELDETNSVVNSFVCLSCQNETFKEIEQENGTHLAIFVCCAAFNIPCLPFYCPDDILEKENRWEEYIKSLEENGKLFAGSKPNTFSDGETNIRRIFGKELSEHDFAGYIAVEQNMQEKLPGTKEQRDRWGTRKIWRNVAMTNEVYNELDEQYKSKLEDFKGVTVTKQMDNVLKDYSKMRVAASHLMSVGSDSFQKLLKAADDMMGSEQMRKKDEKPIENFKTDALVTALEKNGLMENGKFLKLDELIEKMRDTHLKSKKYDYSLDVCDQMILDYHNNIRLNADLPIETELPETMQVEDEYGEFEENETEREEKNKKFLGLTKVSFKKEDTDKKEL